MSEKSEVKGTLIEVIFNLAASERKVRFFFPDDDVDAKSALSNFLTSYKGWYAHDEMIICFPPVLELPIKYLQQPSFSIWTSIIVSREAIEGINIKENTSISEIEEEENED